jgi:hypothetical protein
MSRSSLDGSHVAGRAIAVPADAMTDERRSPVARLAARVGGSNVVSTFRVE